MSTHYYITTPIYYVNAEPHIGNTYTTVLADTVARYHRLAGESTLFLTGTDEYGEKIVQAAAERGLDPKAFADANAERFRAIWDQLGFSYDRFIRTTDPDHRRNVETILQRLHDAGDVEFREYEGLYCVGCERFLTERDLVDGRCRDHDRAPEPRREANYFFRMTRYFDWLGETIRTRPELIQPERYRNEALAMLRDESGLEDLCISRPKTRVAWGIELPFDRGYVCYVWVDALVNYLTGAGWPDSPDFPARWAAVDHLIGKDILKPHAIFWPTILRAAGLPLYRSLRVHGHWLVGGRKISKSLGNLVAPLEMKERYGFEAFRYFLLREMSFGLDANFTEEALVARLNGDLANDLGNLVSRTLNMTARFAGGKVPEPGAFEAPEQAVAASAGEAADAVDRRVREFEFHRALEAVFGLVDATNRYVDARAPWKAAKDPAAAPAVATTLYVALESLRVVSLLLAPFLPATAERVLGWLGVPDHLARARLPGDARDFGQLVPGTTVARGEPLFPRLETPAGRA